MLEHPLQIYRTDVEIIKRKYMLYINTFLYKIFFSIIYHCQSVLHSNLTCTFYDFLLRINLASIFRLPLPIRRGYTLISPSPPSLCYLLIVENSVRWKKGRIQIKLKTVGLRICSVSTSI